MLLEMEHQKTQEARKRQILSVAKAQNMEKVLEEMEEKKQKLKFLVKEAEKPSKTGQLQQKRPKTAMQQVNCNYTFKERKLTFLEQCLQFQRCPSTSEHIPSGE